MRSLDMGPVYTAEKAKGPPGRGRKFRLYRPLERVNLVQDKGLRVSDQGRTEAECQRTGSQGIEPRRYPIERAAIKWGPAAIWAAVLFLLSSISDRPGIAWLPIGDKIAHVALYGVLGAALAWSRWSGRGRPSHALLLGLGLLYGVSDEWHQSFVPGRTASLADLAADAVGVSLGYVTLLALMSRSSALPALSDRRHD